MVYTKVFVGNLSFKTRGQDLAGEFAAAGKVMDANIITRGNRSLGYGFVDMETEESAKSAVSLMNKKNVDGRDINVELARPRDEEKIAERRAKQQAIRPAGAFRGRRPRQPRKSVEEKDESSPAQEKKEESDATPTENSASNNNDEKSPAARGKRRPKRRTANKSAEPEKGEEKSPAVASDANNNDVNKEAAVGSPKAGRPRRARRPRRSVRKNDNEETPASSENQAAGERRGPPYPRRRRNSSRLEGGTPSTTSLFVANLPFAVDNQALEEAFADHHVTSAKVIMNKFGKSKGFGFVEVASEKDQQEALEAMHEKPLQGRNIAVKVAIILKPREETEKSTDASENKKTETETPKATEETDK